MAIKERTEYHFADLEDFEEAPAAVTPPPPTSPSFKDRILALMQGGGKVRRMVLILIGSIIVVLLITKIANFFSTPTPPVIKPKPEVVQEPPSTPSLESEFQRVLAENNRRHEEVVDKLQKKIAESDSKMSAMQFQLDSANHTIEKLTKQLTEKPKEALPPPKKEKVVVVPAKPKLPLYYIQAMVPGRAWLSGSGGTPLTVSVGDELPGYGVVSIIDVNSGTVIMDQGQRITYHPNDR